MIEQMCILIGKGITREEYAIGFWNEENVFEVEEGERPFYLIHQLHLPRKLAWDLYNLLTGQKEGYSEEAHRLVMYVKHLQNQKGR